MFKHTRITLPITIIVLSRGGSIILNASVAAYKTIPVGILYILQVEVHVYKCIQSKMHDVLHGTFVVVSQ